MIIVMSEDEDEGSGGLLVFGEIETRPLEPHVTTPRDGMCGRTTNLGDPVVTLL
jgi:hypothetical protein